MDTNIDKTCELDNLILIYFGQDCDIFDENCDLNTLLNEYLTTSSEFCLRMLLANLLELEAQTDRIEVLQVRYDGEFAPQRWDLTAQAWLDMVKQRLLEYMQATGYSTELSRI
ncbi:hypothetical protein PMPD1_3047 [Paramixta manurensis]|uniref:CdiI immunity protein domain-containing protein n=1 Tax=Paramixta manurensis TaxID=2740817 RepID=A0A6M8UJL7_9GAMM|nr:hypothetical protein PMPD1_3047 [Erwiniaceae bacterium PD-1]